MLIGSAVVAILLFGPLVTAANAQESHVTGTIALHGCSARPTDFVLKAATLGTGGGIANARVNARRGSARRFTFTIGPLALGEAHQLRLQFTGACGPMFWNGPADGLVTTGQTVALQGYAARTRVEILGESVGRQAPRWVGADAFDFADPVAAVRRLRVQTDLTNVTKFVLQIATDPFPVTSASARRACLEDGPSVVRTLAFDAVTIPTETTRTHPGGREAHWTELPSINFNALLLGPLHPGMLGTTAPIDPGNLRMIAAGAPLYIRAIPAAVTSSGALVRRCDTESDGIPGWMMVARVLDALDGQANPTPPFPLRLHSAKYVGPTIHEWPGPGQATCYRTLKPHLLEPSKMEGCWFGACDDVHGWYFTKYKSPAYKAWDTIPTGEYVCTPQSGGGGGGINPLDVVGAFEEAVTGFADTIGGLVKDAGDLWKAIKAKVVHILADVIKGAGVPCDAACEAGLTMGLNLALASAGIPPELPNLEGLKGDLRDYLAAQIADQVAPGVPGTAVLAQKALEFADNALAEYVGGSDGASGGLPDWITPDIGLVPAVLYLTLEHLQDPPPPPLELLPPGTRLLVAKGKEFARSWVDIPRNFNPTKLIIPGALYRDTLKVPVVLRPNLDAVPTSPYEDMCTRMPDQEKCLADADLAYNLALWKKQHWAAGINENSCAWFVLSWWMDDATIFQLPTIPLGFIGFLKTPVLTTAFFNPELTTPAVASYCTP